jgi:hypothetical protein
MRVEDNVQTPSRDHPGRRRLMRVEDDGMCRRRRPTPPASAAAQVGIVVGKSLSKTFPRSFGFGNFVSDYSFPSGNLTRPQLGTKWSFLLKL